MSKKLSADGQRRLVRLEEQVLDALETERLPTWMEEAIWDGDVDTLSERAGCVCCCDVHTFESCPARAWYGCRGQHTPTQADLDEWVRHYGMTRDEFFG